MLQQVLLKMPKIFAYKNNSNEPKFTASENALFYAASKGISFYFQVRFLSVKYAKKHGNLYKKTYEEKSRR